MRRQWCVWVTGSVGRWFECGDDDLEGEEDGGRKEEVSVGSGLLRERPDECIGGNHTNRDIVGRNEL